ncbi:hypothetical protein [Chryseobacterium polytrichastri]|nr:hypothetical protein [Chryseobacterium polytrichastri]
MEKQSKKATSVFSIKKATIKGNETLFTDKILNNDIDKEYIIIIAPQKYQHGDQWNSIKGAAKNMRNLWRNNAGENGKFMFVHQGIRRVKMNQEFGFNWTVLIYSFGYTEAQLNKTKEAFQKFAPDCNFIKIADYTEAVNYINTKNKSKTNDDNKLRVKQAIERVFIYCHGFVGKLAMGLTNISTGDTDLDWDENVVNKLNQNAFSNTAKIYSFSCKTGLGNKRIEDLNNINEEIVYSDNAEGGVSFSPLPVPPLSKSYRKTITLPLLGEKSLAQKFANKTGAMVYAYCSRSDYEDTLNTSDELDFFDYFEAGEKGKKPIRNNKSYEYLLDKKNRKDTDIIRHKELIAIRNRRLIIDGGALDLEGARYPVKGGTTPVGVPSDMKTYIKQK